MEELNVPGVSISLIQNKEYCLHKSFGVSDANTNSQLRINNV